MQSQLLNAQSRAPPLQAPLSVLSQLEARGENGVENHHHAFSQKLSATCIDSKFDATCGNIVVIKIFFELVNPNPQRSLGGGRRSCRYDNISRQRERDLTVWMWLFYATVGHSKDLLRT